MVRFAWVRSNETRSFGDFLTIELFSRGGHHTRNQLEVLLGNDRGRLLPKLLLIRLQRLDRNFGLNENVRRGLEDGRVSKLGLGASEDDRLEVKDTEHESGSARGNLSTPSNLVFYQGYQQSKLR